MAHLENESQPNRSVGEDDEIVLPADYEQLVAEQSSSPRENTHSLILGETALHGLAGRIVRKLEPETEAHPAAMLVEIVMNFGSIIGRTAYYEVEDMTHCGNLFAVRVGQTSKGRKGTAGARINRIFKDVDPVWFQDRRAGGERRRQFPFLYIARRLGSTKESRPQAP